jgi:hypothetical protein
LPPAEFFYFPFDAGPGAESAENQWGEMFVWMRTTGVLTESLTLDPSAGDLAVSPGSLTDLVIQIAVGQAWVQGFMFQHEEDYAYYDIEENSSGDPRIDLVVVELDVDNNIIEEKVVTGTPDPSPVPPTPIQNDTIWQMPLAEIAVADGATTITSMDITDVRVRSVQGDGGSSAVTLTSGTGDESLVSDGVGPDLEIKALTAGTNITLTSDGDQVTIEATGAGSSVTLANAGTTSLVNDGVGPALATKGLVAGTNISFSTSATDVTITGANAPSDSPICFVYKNATTTGLTDGSTTTIDFDTSILNPNSMWNSMTNPSRITIGENGVYYVNALVGWVGVALANGPVGIQILVNGATTIGRSRILIVGADTLYLNASIFYSLSATDYLTLAVINNSGQTLSLTSSTDGPKLQAVKIRS